MKLGLRLFVKLVSHVVLEAYLRRENRLVHGGRDRFLITRVVQGNTRKLVCLTAVSPVADSLRQSMVRRAYLIHVTLVLAHHGRNALTVVHL